MATRVNGTGKNPTYDPPPAKGLAPVLDRNISALRERRLREEKAASWEERLADAISRFTGSMSFVYIHLAVFGFWILANLHWIPGVPAWDECACHGRIGRSNFPVDIRSHHSEPNGGSG